MKKSRAEFAAGLAGLLITLVFTSATAAELRNLSRTIERGPLPHRVHVFEDYETEIEKRWWLRGAPETNNLAPSLSDSIANRRACRATATKDFDDKMGDPTKNFKAVIFNPVPGPPMGTNTRLSFRYRLQGTDTLRVQIYSLTKNYHRALTLTNLSQGSWQSMAVDLTQARRPDGSGGPLAEDERIDDIQFYIAPDAELLIDDIVLYDAAPDRETQPFPNRILFTGWFDTGKQGAEWPGDFEIVPHQQPLTWKAAKWVMNAKSNEAWIRVSLRGQRPLSAVNRLRFRYRVAGTGDIRLTLANSRTGQEWRNALNNAAHGRWAEASVDFKVGERNAFANELRFAVANGGELFVDDVLLFEPVTEPAITARLTFDDTPAQAADASLAATSVAKNRGFVDMTQSSGVAEAIARHYKRHPKWWLSGLNLVDLDGDGQLDLFLAAHGAGRSLALLNDGYGHFREADGSYPASEIHLAADINGDDKLDLQMTWQDGGGKWWLNESTPGRLNFRESSITAGQARANALIDLNRDGNVDWLHERPGVTFEFGDGKGNFRPGGHLEVAPTRNEINMHPADFNGDGLTDLAVHWGRYDYERGKSRVYLNDRKMNFADATEAAGLHEDGLAIKGVGDVNQDGCLDLIVLEDGRPELYLNDGKGKFTRKPGAFAGTEAASKPRYVSWGLAIVTDFDNDGVADILWNGRNFLWLLRGTGGGNFNYMNKVWHVEDKSAASVDDGLCFGDIDGDGALDIIGYTGLLDAHRLVKVYRNDLPVQNWLRVQLTGAAGNRGAAGAKIRLTERGQSDKLLWFDQVTILDSQSAHSYYSLAPTERHFGLGRCREVDVRIEFYPSGKHVERHARANSTVRISEAE